MRVDMVLVHMGTDDESVFALGQRHSQIIADLVRQLRRDLTRLEGLPQVVGDHIILFSLPTGNGGVLPLGKKKLLVSDRRIALIGCDQIAAVGFLWILHIVRHPAQGFGHGPALATMQRHQSCCRYLQNLPSKENGGERKIFAHHQTVIEFSIAAPKCSRTDRWPPSALR